MYNEEGEALNLYNMLPLLEGWEYMPFLKSEAVELGKYKLLSSEKRIGWLLSMDFYSDDAYASLKLTYLGAVGIITPHDLFVTGAILPPPYGAVLSVYIQPSYLSTAGVYCCSMVTTAFPVSIKGNIKIEIGLESSSTQSTASAGVVFNAIAITNEGMFIRSVRRFKYGWLGWVFELLSRIPGLKYIGVPKEIEEVVK